MIIGITGNKGHGKDTVANIIKDNDFRFVSFAFAQPLKLASSILLNIPLIYFDDENLKETILPDWNITPRQFIQQLGTDFCRNRVDKNIFIKNMEKRIAESESNCIIVTDCRFDNEAELILSLGGIIVKVDSSERLGNVNDIHETEQGISSHLIDITIYNNTDTNDLEKEIKIFMNEYF